MCEARIGRRTPQGTLGSPGANRNRKILRFQCSRSMMLLFPPPTSNVTPRPVLGEKTHSIACRTTRGARSQKTGELRKIAKPGELAASRNKAFPKAYPNGSELSVTAPKCREKSVQKVHTSSYSRPWRETHSRSSSDKSRSSIELIYVESSTQSAGQGEGTWGPTCRLG